MQAGAPAPRRTTASPLIALASLLMGSTSLGVAETAPCPVVVVRAGQATVPQHAAATATSLVP